MKVMYLGASVRKGLSKQNDKPYEMAEVCYATPDKGGQKVDPDGKIRWTYTAYGYTVRTIDLEPSAITAFADVKPNTLVDLDIEPIPDFPSRNHVVGVKS